MPTNPSMMVRVQANLDALKEQLATGQFAIQDTTQKMVSLANAYSGARTVQQAHDVMAAIEAVGGVTNLTAKDQASANKVLDEAIQKYQAMGRDVPPAMQALADATRQTTQHTDDLGASWILRIAEGQLLANAIHAVFDITKELAMAFPELVLKGSIIGDVEEAFKHLATQAGLTSDVLLGTLRAGTHGTIDDFALMQRANKDLAAGLNLTDAQFGLLAQGAFALAKATGGSTAEALDKMSDAMVTGRTKGVALLTGKIDLKAAEEAYAESLGGTANQLTTEQKLYADQQAILAAVATGLGRVGEQHDSLRDKVEQSRVAWANFQDDIGKTIAQSPVIAVAFDEIKAALIQAFGGSQKALIDAISSAVDTTAISLVDVGEAGIAAGAFLVKEFTEAKILFGDIAQVIDGVRLAMLMAQQTAAAGILPGTADLEKWQALDETIGRLELTMKQRGQDLQDDVARTTGADTATSLWTKTLEELRAKMEAARAGYEAFVGPIQAVADATDSVSKSAKNLSDDMNASLKATNEWNAALVEINRVGEDWQAIIDAVDGSIVAGIQYYERAGVSQKALATFYGLTTEQVRDLTRALKEQSASMAGDQKGKDEQMRQWLAHWTAYNTVIVDTSDATSTAVSKGSEKAGQSVAEAWKTSQDAAATAAMGESMASAALNDAIDSQIKNVRTLGGAWLTAADARKAYDAGNTLDVGHAAQDPRIMAFLKAGWSLENAEKLKAMQDWGFVETLFDPQGNPETAPSPGERVPGYAAGVRNAPGGWAMVGERGPETMYVPPGANIYPNGSGGGVSPVQIVVNVTQPLGTPEQISRVVGDAVMTSLKSKGFRIPSVF